MLGFSGRRSPASGPCGAWGFWTPSGPPRPPPGAASGFSTPRTGGASRGGPARARASRRRRRQAAELVWGGGGGEEPANECGSKQMSHRREINCKLKCPGFHLPAQPILGFRPIFDNRSQRQRSRPKPRPLLELKATRLVFLRVRCDPLGASKTDGGEGIWFIFPLLV